MRSLLVEFQRFNRLSIGSLRQGDPYLIAVGAQPVNQFEMPLDHDEFLDRMFDLRYKSGPAERDAALKAMAETVTGILRAGQLPDLGAGAGPLQLDLVVNAAELAALPFEAVVDEKGRPLLGRRDRPVVLTRRVRRPFTDDATPWPARPRVLFAWASPPGIGKVPHEEHAQALRAALDQWLPVPIGGEGPIDDGAVLTTLAEADIASLHQVCAESVDAPAGPFTHVHVLAHGYPIARGHRQRYGIALHAPDGGLDAVLPEALAEALAPLRGHAVVVTLATCDAGNMTNTLVPEKSIAHQLHVSGFPVVVASQLPLTVPGSTRLVAKFYHALMHGDDVRWALHEARLALHEGQAETGHDWLALVGYVSLPDTYGDHLKEVRLQAVLQSLRNVQASSDRLVEAGGSGEAFDRIAGHLERRIAGLETFLAEPDAPRRPGVVEENLGLLGSAQKRLAEVHFERGKRGGGGRRDAMVQALTRARDWYRDGFERNLSHHWTGVQYLSLQAVLTGGIDDASAWHAALVAARTVGRRTDAYWAHGSLAEIYLLAPLAGVVVAADAAADALRTLRSRLPASDPFPLESTARQLRRYTSWWTAANGFFAGGRDLAAEAGRLIAIARDG